MSGSRTGGRPDQEELARIRLIFSDLDETLLGPDHRIGPRSLAAARALIRRGVHFVICTGRARETTVPLVEQVGGRYFICNNGATVHDGDRILAASTLPPEVTAEMAAFFTAAGCPAFLMTPAGYGVTGTSPAIEAANRARGVWPRLLTPAEWAVPAYKVMPWGAAHLYEEALARWQGRAQIVYHPEYLEIGPPGVSKAEGARRLAAHLGIPPEHIAAIGDALNDVELVGWAGLGVAMGNAVPEVKAVARWVVGDHGADGAADLLEAVLAAQEQRTRGG